MSITHHWTMPNGDVVVTNSATPPEGFQWRGSRGASGGTGVGGLQGTAGPQGAPGSFDMSTPGYAPPPVAPGGLETLVRDFYNAPTNVANVQHTAPNVLLNRTPSSAAGLPGLPQIPLQYQLPWVR